MNERIESPEDELDEEAGADFELATGLLACEIEYEVPVSEAVVPEAVDYVVHLCGLECYERWQRRETS